MKTLIIVDLTPIDKEKLSEYSSLAAQTLEPYGGNFIAKGPIETLHGGSAFKVKAVIQFPNKDNAINWYNSDAYQAIIATRDEGMHSQFHLVS